MKKIALPEEYTNPELFVDGNRLVIVSNTYDLATYKGSWINRNDKAVVVVYDISDVANPSIAHYYQIDGNYSDARLVNGQITVISNMSFGFPYDQYIHPLANGTSSALDTQRVEDAFATANFLPKKVELIPTQKNENIHDTLAQASTAHQLRELNAANCSAISYVLPDEKTLALYNFQPSFTTVSTFDIRNTKIKSTAKMLF